MLTDHLTAEARWENAATLASALGIRPEQAVQLLEISILITADANDEAAQGIAREVSHLLDRTVGSVLVTDIGQAVDAELVIGAQRARTEGPRVYVQVTEHGAVLDHAPTQTHSPCFPILEIQRLLVACYACAAALNASLGGALPFGMPQRLAINFDQFAVDWRSILEPVDLGHAYVAGAGAITNGFLWAARHLDFRGALDVVDDDRVSSGNLNRQIWFGPDDVGQLKVDCLVAHAQSSFKHLQLRPRQARLQDLPEKEAGGPWLKKLIVGVDSRRARRALQNEFPGEVFDASTTDIREIVTYYGRHTTEHACLSCIYEQDQEELSREQHIAEHLGVSVEDVRTERISARAASLIESRFPAIDARAIEGTAYDSLFKRLCSEGSLRSLSGQRVLAPFAFVSVLAGLVLALEIVRRARPTARIEDNYWRLSPWHAPFQRRRVLRPRQPNCDFCGSPLLRRVNMALWGGATSVDRILKDGARGSR